MTTFDLIERTEKFAIEVRLHVKDLKSPELDSDLRQLIRSSGSIGANYIEANENLGKRDFVFRLKIARKEAKECAYWLRILYATTGDSQLINLTKEATEIMLILSSMINNVMSKNK